MTRYNRFKTRRYRRFSYKKPFYRGGGKFNKNKRLRELIERSGPVTRAVKKMGIQMFKKVVLVEDLNLDLARVAGSKAVLNLDMKNITNSAQIFQQQEPMYDLLYVNRIIISIIPSYNSYENSGNPNIPSPKIVPIDVFYTLTNTNFVNNLDEDTILNKFEVLKQYKNYYTFQNNVGINFVIENPYSTSSTNRDVINPRNTKYQLAKVFGLPNWQHAESEIEGDSENDESDDELGSANGTDQTSISWGKLFFTAPSSPGVLRVKIAYDVVVKS